jgi:hypothetical protein
VISISIRIRISIHIINPHHLSLSVYAPRPALSAADPAQEQL